MLMKVKKRVPELLHLLDQVLIYKILKHYRLAKQRKMMDHKKEREEKMEWEEERKTGTAEKEQASVEDGAGEGEENRNC